MVVSDTARFFFPLKMLNIQTVFILNLDPLDVGQCTHYFLLYFPHDA